MYSKLSYVSLFIASSIMVSVHAVNTNQIPTTQTTPPQFATNQTIINAAPINTTQPVQTFTLPPSIIDIQSEKLEPVLDKAPLACLLMIKDEAHVIKETLDPYVKAGFKYFLIYEAGRSSDNTVEVTRQYFKDNGIVHGYIVQGTFGDFSSARNKALDAAHEKFPNVAFVTFGDAEWYLHNGEKLFEFCQAHLNELSIHSYSMRIMNPGTDFDTPRLIRNDGVSRFKGRVHEVPLPSSMYQVTRDVYFELGGTVIGAKKSRKRWEQDAAALMLDHLENPNDNRPLFYLGQTYEGLSDAPQEKPCSNDKQQLIDCFSPEKEGYASTCCQEQREQREQKIKLLEKAYEFYKKRAAMKAWDQEDFVAVLRLGNIAERLVEAGSKNHTWAEAEHLYLQAYNMRPSRAEPLVQLAEHEWNKNIDTPEKRLALAFLYARRAVEIPYPKNDLLFINKWFYDFKRYELLSKIAYYVGECPIGERATDVLIQNYANPQWYRNKAVYLECNQHNTDLWGYNATCPRQ